MNLLTKMVILGSHRGLLAIYWPSEVHRTKRDPIGSSYWHQCCIRRNLSDHHRRVCFEISSQGESKRRRIKERPNGDECDGSQRRQSLQRRLECY